MAVQQLGNETTTVYTKDLDYVMERVFDAPRDLVWKVMTDPQTITRWWGPNGYTTDVVEMDVRPGGRWRFINRSPDGEEAPFKGEYLEVVPPERLVQTFIFDIEPFNAASALTTMTLEDLGGKTKVRTVDRYPSAEALEGALSMGMTKGAIETWDRLAEELARRS